MATLPPPHTPPVRAANWIRFLRGYGPVPQNENMFDEFIRRSARRLGVEPIAFEHPARAAVLDAVCGSAPTSVVLTGTAGDGKTHLCRHVWEAVGGDEAAWHAADPYVRTPMRGADGAPRTLHVLRDLSAWVPARGRGWEPNREALLTDFSAALARPEVGDDLYVLAANDGQLMEAWQRLPPTPAVARARAALETLLVDDRPSLPGVPLRFLNMSRSSSAALFDRAQAATVAHPGWLDCYALAAPAGAFFGPDCPIRRNLELLATPLVARRLRALLTLCDQNRLHIPVRQILLLLANALLGHPKARERLLTAADVPRLHRDGTVARASLYDNVFGGNLCDERRERTLVFDALGRFGIGHETSNRIDNVLIFGDADDALRADFDRFLGADPLYGADPSYRAAQREYVEGDSEDGERGTAFLRRLVGQRRGLFFKIPEGEHDGLDLWELTVFRYAGEYLDRVLAPLGAGERVGRPIISRLVRGLNRVFTGMLVVTDRELLLATSLTSSASRVSRLLEERVSVEPRLGERIDIVARDGAAVLEVSLSPAIRYAFPLHLTRYEFLSRVAEGALPSSFSKECYEDVLAFKSRLLAGLARRRADAAEERAPLAFQLLDLDDGGRATTHDLEVRDA